MKCFVFSLLFLTVSLISPIYGQGAVQLPEFQHFDASTTVMVPDGGSINTGGITRSSSGGTSSGTPILPFRNRSYGSSNGTSSVQTSVQIIDLHEMDEAILNSPTAPTHVRRADEPLIPEDRFQQKTTGIHRASSKTTHDVMLTRVPISKNSKNLKKSASKDKKSKRSDALRKPLDLSQPK